MRIAVVTRNMGGGGAERVIAQLLKCWHEMGVDCTLVCMHPQERFYRLPEGVECYDVPDFSENPNVDKLKRYAYLRRLMKKLKPDVVLALPEEIGIYVLPAMLFSGIPVVVSERNNPWVMPYKKISRLLRRLFYPTAKGLIFQTEQAASFFPKGQRKKGIVLPNPLDLSRLPEPYTGQREKQVVSAGRLTGQKNFPLLIEAFGIFREKHPEYQLVIYGEGEERSALQALAAKLPEGSVCLPGQVKDLPRQVSRCAVFALSSDYEGVPNVLIEAMAVGTPAVSTDCAPGGAAALIESGKNGILVPVGDKDALAQGLCYMAEHPEKAGAMAKEALTLREKLEAAKVAKDWLDYLTRIRS